MQGTLGDFTTGATVTARFTTEDATGAPITLAGTPSARVRKGSGSGTTITAGVTLAVDTVTGQHVVDVDTAADAAYTAASDYHIELAAGTVSGVSVVGRIVGKFSLANRHTLTGAQIADAHIARNIAGGSDGGRTVGHVYAMQRNKVTLTSIDEGAGTATMNVYDVDDTTLLYTAACTLTAVTKQLTAVDPA